MSSPFHSLSKEKRAPLSPSPPGKQFGRRSMPFRKAEYTSNEKLLLDEITSQMNKANDAMHGVTSRTLLEPIMGSPRQLHTGLLKTTKTSAATKISNGKTPQPPSDMDLMSSMMQRITTLEKQNIAYTREIIEKDTRIKVLEEKLVLYKKSSLNGEKDESTKVKNMERKCLELQQQVYEMETFLAEYGMIWVGEKSNSDSNKYVDETTDATNKYDKAWESVIADTKIDFQPDYDLVVKNVQELNIIAGEGQSHVQKTAGGARLKVAESVRLILYKNGIVLFNGPFRSFNDEQTRRCMTDLMDGYFPSELEERYPEGVPIDIIDNRSVTFRDHRLLEEFPGVGHLLGGQKKPSKLLPSSTSISPKSSDHTPKTATRAVMTSQNSSLASTKSSLSTHSSNSDECKHKNSELFTSELPGPKLSVEQFVTCLPQSVIRSGNVIDVRSSISKHLNGDQLERSTEVIETDVVTEMQKRMDLPESDRPLSAKDITTLRVKTEDGRKTFLIKMKFAATIRDVKKYIDKQRPLHKAPYDIVSNFPTKIHSNISRTLQECGLTPNANVCLRVKKQSQPFKR